MEVQPEVLNVPNVDVVRERRVNDEEFDGKDLFFGNFACVVCGNLHLICLLFRKREHPASKDACEVEVDASYCFFGC